MSQDSPASLVPFPHTDFVHVLGVPAQEDPGSTRQVVEQPSPPTLLPSSHISVPMIIPSPQAGTHLRPGTRHSYPVSTLLQSAEQPSPPAVLPSSQASLAASLPSPHTEVIVQTLGEPVQVQPSGIWQIALQPSPPVLLPSSHPSPVSSVPSPHLAVMMMIPSTGGGGPSVPVPAPLPPPPLELAPPSWPPGFSLTPAQAAARRQKRSQQGEDMTGG